MSDQEKNIFDLEFADLDTCLNILKKFKCTRVEGLLVEYAFDLIFRRKFLESGWILYRTPIYKLWKKSTGDNQLIMLLDPRKRNYSHLCEQLEKTGMPVRYAYPDFSDGKLHIFLNDSDHPVRSSISVADLLDEKLVYGTTESERLKNSARVERIFPILAKWLGSDLVDAIIELLVKDYYISRFSFENSGDGAGIQMWDFDYTAQSPDGQFHIFEIKHKFPTPANWFGMNRGEKFNAENLTQAGFKVWHFIMVKPWRNPDISSAVLFSSNELAQKTLLVVGNLSDESFFNQTSYLSPAHTSISNTGRVTTYKIFPEKFYFIGAFSENSGALSDNLLSFITGNHQLDQLTEEQLKNNCLSDIEVNNLLEG